LINNRQGGRRRGRGGQRGQNLGGQPGNRQDNRQRGNAAQLLEKYKSMARDAQLAGDRVQTEHYLQFADHYFRVLSESRARFEDQNPRRQRDDDSDDDEDEMMEAGEAESSPDNHSDREERQDRGEHFSPRGRPRRDDRQESAASEESEPRHVNGETMPFDALPPAIGRDDGDAAADKEPRRPRARRPRAARPDEGEEEAAPAA
jgi:uncharacterized protein DUF4167